MPETKIDSADYGDQLNTETEFSVASVDTDGPTDSKETEYINTDWGQQLGYYKKIPELRTSIDALARWTLGKGFKASSNTTNFLKRITGFGKDTFNTILENLSKVSKIGGDSFAEIIRRDDGDIINIKPLDPGTMKIIVNKQGLIIRYEQITKGDKPNTPFKPEDIFHLSRNRTADEIHGISLINAVVEIILARNEAMAVRRVVVRRYAKPLIIWHVDTDNEAEIAAFKAKADKVSTQGENFFVPKDVVVPEIIAVANNQTMNLTPIINDLNNAFFQATGVPQIIVGGGQEITEASAKIAYMAFEQTVEEEQLYLEEQCFAQLGIIIKLEFPASLENELLSDKAKSETMQASTPEDTSVKDVGVNPPQGVQT